MRSIWALVVIVGGAIWNWGGAILNGIGNALDVVDMGDRVTDFQVWLANHPGIASDYGPWVLIIGGVISLAITHGAPFVRQWWGDDIEIIYDPHDSRGRFAAVDLWYLYNSNEHLTALVLRIGVRNVTRKTMRNVSGTIEGSFGEFMTPKSIRFSRSRELMSDLHPKSMELMDLMGLSAAPEEWPLPDGVHHLTVRIRAEDSPEVVKEFALDKSKMPPLYLEKSR